MTAQKTSLFNAFETELSAAVGAADLTFNVDATAPLTSPCYLVIDPTSASKREYVLFDGTFTSTAFVTTSTANRGLGGSAAGAQAHAAGTTVRCVPMHQHFGDLNDRVDLRLTETESNAAYRARVGGGFYDVTAAPYNAVGDGSTDATAAIQAAVDAAQAAGAGAVSFPEGIYVVSSPIRVPARVQLVGVANGDISGGAVIRASASWGTQTNRAVVEAKDYWNFVSADWWHYSGIESIRVDANNVAEFGIALYGMGEQSLLRRVAVFDATVDCVLLVGTHAVGQIEDCSVWSAGRYGLSLTSHPEATHPGTGNGGSVRLYGLSGDGNATAHIHANGSHTVHASGLKSEAHTQCVLIAGSGVGGTRQKWYIDGRSEGATGATDFIRIQGTARPSILLGPLHLPTWTNVVNDMVASETLAMVSSGYGFVYWGRDGDDKFVIETVEAVVDGRLTVSRAGSVLQGQVQFKNDTSGAGPIVAVPASADAVALRATGATGHTTNVIEVRGGGGTPTGAVLSVQDSTGTTEHFAVEVDGTAKLGGTLDHNGASAGFYGAAPVSKPSGVTSASALETLGLAASITDSATYVPAMVEVSAIMYPSAGGATWATVIQSGSRYGAAERYQSTAALNDEVSYTFRCAAGTYRLDFGQWKDPARGIATVYLDGVSVGTIDQYASSGVAAIASLTGITVTSVGEHTLRFKVESKNASSSNYYFGISKFVFSRTGP